MDRSNSPWPWRAWLRLTVLEGRTLPAAGPLASLRGGVLRGVGTGGADGLRLRLDKDAWVVDGAKEAFAPALVRAIDVSALGGNDVIDLRGVGGRRAVPATITLDGGAGNDSVYGSEAADTLLGGDGDDRIWAGAGNDYLDGGPGNDSLFGEWGDDTLFGDLGDDYLDGGAGSDRLTGGAGANTLRGDADDGRLGGGTASAWFDTALADAGLRSLSRLLANDGALDRADVLQLFDQVETDGTVSAAEFDGLKALLRPSGFTMPDAVAGLMANVVEGDPANAHLQGA